MKKISNLLKTKTLFLPLFTLLIAFTVISCSEDNDDNSPNDEEQTANITVRMTDAPGDYDAVYVDVEDVMIKAEATEDEEEGWVSVGNVDADIYNLLELTGGVTALLADSEIPAGPISQIRLILGTDNSVVMDGVSIPLSTPSAQQSGLKLQVNETLEADQNYDFLLDFDVEESIVVSGASGQFILKPVIRLSVGEANATITGQIHPTDVQTLVAATNANLSVSAYTNSEGVFSLNGIPAGTYQITITPDADSGFGGTVVNDVVVEIGETEDLGTIFLE
ncbi:MAG TPA: DUF4382 domain-containing protein [Salinimicrobium sp.]|nr:DUF4382 domain-containing protein [Salinimicrobium sp.]